MKPFNNTQIARVTTLILGLLTATNSAWAATAAFCGKVTAVKEAEAKQKDTLSHFTIEIDYYDYISRGKFGRQSKVGESIDQKVLKIGSVCVINGRMVNAATFAKAIQPGQWGYFYETTWLDLQTTPNFQWGEVVATDKEEFTLRVHHTHKDIHLETNPPVEIKVPYDKGVSYRLEDKPTDAAKALQPGNWVQIHEERPQMVALWNDDTAFNPVEQQPVEQGRRGLANDLSCPAVLGKVQTKTPDGVLDFSAQVTCDRWLKGKQENLTMDIRKVAFVLDGKLAPAKIAAKPGRRAVLCHYRTEKTPHKILVRSADDAIRGTIVVMNEKTLRIATSEGTVEVALEQDAQFQVDGLPADWKAVAKKGGEVVIYPKRGRTIIAFTPVDVE
ncbi:MAG: hypothetical protein COA78_37725 [Blastopirellula sp.]|nr:MAG: hypothetical protein COA78_37725 [Blastopirellula sp.]